MPLDYIGFWMIDSKFVSPFSSNSSSHITQSIEKVIQMTSLHLVKVAACSTKQQSKSWKWLQVGLQGAGSRGWEQSQEPKIWKWSCFFGSQP